MAPKKTLSPKSKPSDIYLWALTIGYFFSSLVFTGQIIDEALIPRFISLSLVFLVVLFLFLITRNIALLKGGINYVSVAGFVYYLFCLANSFRSHNPSEGIFESQRVLILVLIIFWTSIAIKEGETFIKIFIKSTLIIGILTLIFATYQYSKIYHIGDPWYYYTIYAFNAHKNLFSSYLFLLLVFSIWGIQLFTNKIWKALAILCSLSYAFYILLVQTRATWLGFFVSILFFAVHYFWKKPRFSNHVMASIFVVTFSFSFMSCNSIENNAVLSSYLEKIKFWKYTDTYSGNERLVLWGKTIEVFKDSWIIGCGTGDWQIMFQKPGWHNLEIAFRANTTFQRPHNDWLWVLSEQGLVGFLIYLGFIVAPFVWALRFYYSNRGKDFTLLLLLSGWVGWAVISFFDFPKERFEHLILIGILISFLAQKANIKPLSVVNSTHTYFLCFIIPCLLIFNLILGKKRFEGEKYAYQLFQAYKNNAFERVIYFGNKAKSFYYQIDGTSIPIDWYIGMAKFYLRTENFGQNELENAFAKNPYNPHVINNLATTYETLAKHQEAKNLFKAAINSCPYFEDPKFNLSVIYTNEYNFDSALTLMNEIKLDTNKRNTFIKIIKERELNKK